MTRIKQKYNMMETVPAKAERIQTSWDDTLAVLGIPRFRHAWMNKLLPQGISPYIHVTLDERGTEVWQQIDGKATTAEIISRLSVKHLGEDDYESRIAAFIEQLHRDGLIVLHHGQP